MKKWVEEQIKAAQVEPGMKMKVEGILFPGYRRVTNVLTLGDHLVIIGYYGGLFLGFLKPDTKVQVKRRG